MGVYTNTMRYTGTSGVDVESMVQALMKSEGMKADRIYRERQKLEWEQQMFRDMGTSVKTFNNNYLSFSSTSSIVNMRSTNAYAGKTVTGKFSGGDAIASGSTKNSLNIGGNSSISTTGNTPPGEYEFDIKSVATADTYTGKTMGSNVTVNAENVNAVIDKTIAGEPGGLKSGDYLDVTVNGSAQRLTLGDADITAIKDAGGGKASADKLASALQTKINSKFGTITQGSETTPKVSVTADAAGNLIFDPREDLGISFSANAPSGVVNATPATMDMEKLMPVGTDGTGFLDGETGKIVADGKDTYTIGGKEVSVEYKAGQSKDDYLKSLNTAISNDKDLKGKVSASYDSKGNLQFKQTSYGADIEISSVTRATATGVDEATGKTTYSDPVDTGVASATATSSKSLYKTLGFDPTASSSTFNVNQKISTSLDPTTTTYPLSGTIKVGSSKIAINVDENTTYKDLMDQVNKSGKASLTFNKNTNSFSLQSKQLGENGKITFDEGAGKIAAAFQLDEASGGTHKAATNAEVFVKGPNGISQTLVRETNTFSYADINFKLDPSLQTKIDEAKAGGADGLKVEMSVTANTDEAFDNIKGFIDAYNTLIEGLSAATDTPRAKAGDYSYYEPLTEEEKEGMSDEQIKKMEDKAKQGLLYRNPELTRLQSKLREITTTSVTLADGSKMSLASIGITTGDYSQGGKLFIDEDKLRNALETNSDGVAKLFTDSKNGVAEKMYTAINDAVGSDGYITQKVGFTDSIYSKNNYYTKQIEEKSKELDKMNTYLINKENYYYSMFANMEKVITEANNQMAALSNY